MTKPSEKKPKSPRSTGGGRTPSDVKRRPEVTDFDRENLGIAAKE